MAKRRCNGEGSIRKRKDGRWEGRYTVGHDPVTGKQIIKNVISTQNAIYNAESIEDIKSRSSGSVGRENSRNRRCYDLRFWVQAHLREFL